MPVTVSICFCLIMTPKSEGKQCRSIDYQLYHLSLWPLVTMASFSDCHVWVWLKMSRPHSGHWYSERQLVAQRYDVYLLLNNWLSTLQPTCRQSNCRWASWPLSTVKYHCFMVIMKSFVPFQSHRGSHAEWPLIASWANHETIKREGKNLGG